MNLDFLTKEDLLGANILYRLNKWIRRKVLGIVAGSDPNNSEFSVEYEGEEYYEDDEDEYFEDDEDVVFFFSLHSQYVDNQPTEEPEERLQAKFQPIVKEF